jgi:hypothetical protein
MGGEGVHKKYVTKRLYNAIILEEHKTGETVKRELAAY